MTPGKASALVRKMDSAQSLVREPEIRNFLAKNSNLAFQARQAAGELLSQFPNATHADLVRTLRHVLESLSRGTLKVFFSYKKKDEAIAKKIAGCLKGWSADKLRIEGMERFAVQQPGQDFRKKIFETIPRCDWFLLLLPDLGEQGDERDWVLLEAGYYLRGMDLAGRLVCLHHPENEVANALEDRQHVPAERDAVKEFLTGLLLKPNWIPGIPALNESLQDVDAKAKELVELIKPPVIRSCCGPHIEVRFDDPSAVTGWQQLAAGTVIESNAECRELFGLTFSRTSFGDWLKKAHGAGKDDGWVSELAHAVKAVGDGETAPPIYSTINLGQSGHVQPMICAVKRRKKDQRIEAINFLFTETKLAPETSMMTRDFAALALTLQYAVRFRYQLLKKYAHRKLEAKDVLAFHGSMVQLQKEVILDRRFQDIRALQSRVATLFAGDEKAIVEHMYERAAQMWRPGGDGEVDCAIANLDSGTLAKLIDELLELNQSFLTVTSKRFAELVAQN